MRSRAACLPLAYWWVCCMLMCFYICRQGCILVILPACPAAQSPLLTAQYVHVQIVFVGVAVLTNREAPAETTPFIELHDSLNEVTGATSSGVIPNAWPGSRI
jgi:hypothetical protein